MEEVVRELFLMCVEECGETEECIEECMDAAEAAAGIVHVTSTVEELERAA